jgi:hypothetical protein
MLPVLDPDAGETGLTHRTVLFGAIAANAEQGTPRAGRRQCLEKEIPA